MQFGPSERQYHTRLGWWLMTHDRGGAVAFSMGASAALAADIAYVATRWTNVGSSFGRAFLAGAGCITVGLAFAMVFAGPRPIGTDRRRARRRARVTNGAMTLLIFAAVVAFNRVGGSLTGAVLGLLAPPLFAFAAYALWTALRPQVANRSGDIP